MMPDGVHKLAHNRVDITGEQFGRWTALSPIPSVRGFSKCMCKCECGTEKSVATRSLRNGESRSCGCLARELMHKPRGPRQVPERRAINAMFHDYKYNARVRKLSWDLTQEQFEQIASMDCFYCGLPPAPRRYQGFITVPVNGIDRVDNTQGYEQDNVVATCTICNYAKCDRPYDDFILA